MWFVAALPSAIALTILVGTLCLRGVSGRAARFFSILP